jgi:hypothetical protein
MNARSVTPQCSDVNFLYFFRVHSYYWRANQLCWEETMKLKTIAYAAFIAIAAGAFVIGSGGASEAKGKKKMAAPPPEPGPCFMIAGPVCGAKGGMKFTYANACYAAKDGASVVAKGACKPAKAHKKAKKVAKPAKKMDKKPAAKKDEKKKM